MHATNQKAHVYTAGTGGMALKFRKDVQRTADINTATTHEKADDDTTPVE